MRSNPTLRKWYKILNKKWFKNKLPKNVLIGYSEELLEEGSRTRPAYGDSEWNQGERAVIRINPLLREGGWYTAIRGTLIHEMSHLLEIKQKMRGDHAIKGWDKIMRTLANKGAFSKKNGISKLPLW